MIENIKKLIKQNQKLFISLLVIILVILSIVLLTTTGVLNKIIDNFKKQEEPEEFTYKIYKVNGNFGTALIKFYNENGINTITYKNKDDEDFTINCNEKIKVAIDYEMEDRKTYQFIANYTNGEEKTFTIDFEIPRIQGLYTEKNGIYVNEPDLTGFIKEETRYMYLDNNEKLLPGKWIVEDAQENWYDYKEQKWANIYVENEGIASYYVWIPRYCYKIDTENSVSGNERMDVKFINVYNEYIDAKTNEKQTWEDLEKEGYQIPEAFSWENEEDIDYLIPGYWMSKYQLSELTGYTVDYSAVVNLTTIEITNIKVNTNKTVSEYIFAINGIEDARIPAKDVTNYTLKNISEGNKYINLTALDENGEIIGSMTRTIEVAEANSPDLTGFDKDTTFYVYWDEDGNEHNQIPISMDPPSEWYNYTIANWANIVTRNNGIESYFVWIPRYSYKLNTINQRSYIKFLKGTSSEVEEGYKIPEAFWWDNNSDGIETDDEQLPGYWMSKYQLSQEETIPKINAEMSAGSNLIRIKDITGTLIDTAKTNNINIEYKYYLNGIEKHTGISELENYVFTELEENKTYTVNIIARNSDTNEYIGAITKKITTVTPYAPDISAFDKDTTFYVVYDNDGNETRISLNETVPSNWYDYSNQQWANIVTTANNTESYFVWIPRYEYTILGDRAALNTANRRIDVNFITTDITNSNCTIGYQVPEAFWWDNNGNNQEDDGEQLTGYWMSKYQLSN